MPTPWRRARTFGVSGRVLADGNVDRQVESAEVDIPARHSKDANVDPVAICLPDAHVDGKNERRAGRPARTTIGARPGGGPVVAFPERQ